MPTKYEFYDGPSDGGYYIWGVNWYFQTFTVGTVGSNVAHLLASVKLNLSKAGSPTATMTVTVYAVDGNGKPTGSALYTGTLVTSTLTASEVEYEIPVSGSALLATSTKYVMVVKCPSAVDGVAPRWHLKGSGGGYAGGQYGVSNDSGTTWTTTTAQDFLFEEWGDTGTSAPSVTTQATSAVTATTATGNGTIVSLGLPAATQYGHVWATFPNPTTADSKTEKGVPTATGAYTSSITGLSQNTLYYVRAYITNSAGTFYGAEWQFGSFTTSADVPVVTTELATYVFGTNALGNGTIVNDGGSAITQHGVCWSTSANPTTADSKKENGTANFIGSFSGIMTGLTVGTLYHVRAFATNTTGTGYGADVTFTTLAAGVPMVRTDAMSSVFATTAIGNGNIIDIGGAAVTEHGHCWSTSVNPTTADSKTTKGAGAVGAFQSQITGLTAGTAYYTRAYATNSYGTAYGNNVAFNETPAGELKAVIKVKDESFVYISKSGKRRALLGVEY